MTTQQIEYVLMLAHEKSFSKAARKLYVTQPSLSQFIMSIEKQLGTALFDRSTSPIQLTPAGEAFVSSAEKIKAIEDNLYNEISDLQNLKKGTLKIGASTFRSSCMLSKSISIFCKNYTGINITVVEDSIDILTQMVQNNELDIVIGTGDFESKSFHTESLAKEELYLAVPPNYMGVFGDQSNALNQMDIRKNSIKLIKKHPIDLSLAADLPFIVIEHGEFGTDVVHAICKEYGFIPTQSLTVKTLETAFSLVNAGLGVTFIPDTLIRFGNYLAHPMYFAVKSKHNINTVSLISRKNDYFSKAAIEYCHVLKTLVDIGTWRVL